MLQQTRVETAMPYFERWLERFPSLEALAGAAEADVLAAWSGLGYYGRARNLHRAAKEVMRTGEPRDFESVRKLAGVGEYTAAAIASIVFGEPRAALDGNVTRVMSRLLNDSGDARASKTRRRFAAEATRLIDRARPGDFNQAMMELGATICTPKSPRCAECPVARLCAAHAAGTVGQLPVRLGGKQAREIALDLALVLRDGAVYLVRRGEGERRLAGFRELPEKSAVSGAEFRMAARFTHQIVNDRFRVKVWRAARVDGLPPGEWIALADLGGIPVTTVTRKALRSAGID